MRLRPVFARHLLLLSACRLAESGARHMAGHPVVTFVTADR
jgi:hypothetical protein